MNNIITLILGGGKGTRLFPLTKLRSKPAVPLAGKYRLIDIPISNCLNSGLNRIYVLTQFNSVSLNRHINQAYKFDLFGGGFVEVLAAQQTINRSDWYQGTADAVRQNIKRIEAPGIDYVLILSGDQLYRMNFREMIRTHQQSKAQVTIAALPVDRKQASSFGIMKADDTGRVQGFVEKPRTSAELQSVRTEPAWIDQHGIHSRGRDCLASMGIYLFNRDTLVETLTQHEYQDFGKEVFPAVLRSRHVQLHLFDGYWEDIGTHPGVLRGQPAARVGESPLPIDLAKRPHLQPLAVPAPLSIQPGVDFQQHRRRRVPDWRRDHHREQRDRCAVPDWQERGDPQLDFDGCRRFPDPGGNPRGPNRQSTLHRNWRRLDH